MRNEGGHAVAFLRLTCFNWSSSADSLSASSAPVPASPFSQRETRDCGMSVRRSISVCDREKGSERSCLMISEILLMRHSMRYRIFRSIGFA